MKRFAVLAAALLIGVGGMTQQAQARWRGAGGAIAAGFIGAAIVGAAAASAAPVYYAPRRVYYAPRPVVRYRYVRPRVVYYAPRRVYYAPRVVTYRYVRPARWHRRYRW